MHEERHVVVQVGKSDSVFGSDRLSDDNFVNVVELVPIFVSLVVVFDQRLELGTARDCHVECLCCKEAFRIEQVEEIVIDEIGQQLICQAIQSRHRRQRQVPLAER